MLHCRSNKALERHLPLNMIGSLSSLPAEGEESRKHSHAQSTLHLSLKSGASVAFAPDALRDLEDVARAIIRKYNSGRNAAARDIAHHRAKRYKE